MANTTTYPIAAPVFADDEPNADILGYAADADEAMALYREFYFDTGTDAVMAVKACPDRRGEGPVDGWVPKLTSEGE